MYNRFVEVREVISILTERKVRYDLFLLQTESTNEICLIIDSPGGDTGPARGIAEVISVSKVPIVGIVGDRAFSAGFIVLQSCHKRVANKYSRFMFHAPGFTAEEAATVLPFPCDGDVRFEDDEKYLEWLSELSSRSGQSFDQLRIWGIEEKEFTADEALSFGFIDEIVV